MKFIYPAIIRPTSQGKFHAFFPDLDCCEADGDTLEEAVENANEAASNWIAVELETDGQMPPISDESDMHLQEGDIVRNICVTVRFYEGWDE